MPLHEPAPSRRARTSPPFFPLFLLFLTAAGPCNNLPGQVLDARTGEPV